MRILKLSILTVTLFFLLKAFAFSVPLPAFQAFQFKASYNENKMLQLDWKISPNYHLYKSSITVTPSQDSSIKVGEFYFPDSTPFQGRASYSDHLNLQVPIKLNGAKSIDVNVAYQGCSGNGYCYAPVYKEVHINLNTPAVVKQKTLIAPASTQGYIASLLAHNNLAWVLLVFVGLGILLTFTPCVLPMIPILSGIIIGHGKKMTTGHAFLLSLVYVLGMAITYAIAGLVVALAGAHIQAALQSPPIIIVFAIIFILLSFSLFGFYELRLPRRFEEKVAGMSRKQKSGSYIGSFVMGILSTLIVSPCVSAPLVGVLIYIGKTGDVTLGALSLFALGIGMGIPLLIIGTSAGKILPKTGRWMNIIKSIFGVLLIAVAILMLGRILPDLITFALWAVLAIVCAVYMGALRVAVTGWQMLWKGLGIALLVYGIALMIGVLQGNASFTRPLSLGTISVKKASQFISVNNITALKKQLATAKSNKQPVLLDFSAKWCEDCQVMARTTFTNAKVLTALHGYRLITVDLTESDEATHVLRQHYNVIGTPTVMFIDSHGKVMSKFTRVGGQDAEQFVELVSKVSHSAF